MRIDQEKDTYYRLNKLTLVKELCAELNQIYST